MSGDIPSTREVWTSDARTALLRERADRASLQSGEETRAILDAAELRPGMRVLDIACGPGDPTLEVARVLGPEGTAVGIDISEGALEVARERALRAGLPNATFRTASAESLPFPSASFDRAVCRFGAMYIGDIVRGLRETRRVLAPGGRVVLMVWGPFEQPHFVRMVGLLLRHLNLTELPPAMRTPFRFSAPGSLEGALAEAAFANVRGRSLTIDWVWEGTVEACCEDWRTGSVLYRPLIDAVPDGERSGVWAEMAEGLREFVDGTSLRVPLRVRLVSGDVAGP